MVVELMANIPPKKMQSIFDQSKACPTNTPNIDMEKMITMVEMNGEAPIFNIFLNEKSRPNENNKNMTPMSAHRWIFSVSATDAVYGMWGDTKNPATI